MLLLVTALVIFNFLAGIPKPSSPTLLPAMTRAETTPSVLLGPPNSQRQGLTGHLGEMGYAQKRENSRQKQVTQYLTASQLSIIPHQEKFSFP